MSHRLHRSFRLPLIFGLVVPGITGWSQERALTLEKMLVEGADPAAPREAEEAPTGEYGQPEWTTERRFPGTRVYLQQGPWDWGVEQWVRHRHFRDSTSETRFQEEFEVGLPHRFQIDLYETWSINQDRRTSQDEYSA
jgi:hypothetical protein